MEIQKVIILIPPETGMMVTHPNQNGPTLTTSGIAVPTKGGRVGLIVPKLDMRHPDIPRVSLAPPPDGHRSFGFGYVICKA